MKASQLMTTHPATCRSTDSLERAAQLMRVCDIGYVPVVDGDDQICGVITDRDICLAALAQGKALREISVSAAMSDDVVTACEDDDIETVERSMRDSQVRRIPVIDEACHPVGVISLNDIALAYQQARLPAGEVASTLAAICQPRNVPTF